MAGASYKRRACPFRPSAAGKVVRTSDRGCPNCPRLIVATVLPALPSGSRSQCLVWASCGRWPTPMLQSRHHITGTIGCLDNSTVHWRWSLVPKALAAADRSSLSNCVRCGIKTEIYWSFLNGESETSSQTNDFTTPGFRGQLQLVLLSVWISS